MAAAGIAGGLQFANYFEQWGCRIRNVIAQPKTGKVGRYVKRILTDSRGLICLNEWIRIGDRVGPTRVLGQESVHAAVPIN